MPLGDVALAGMLAAMASRSRGAATTWMLLWYGVMRAIRWVWSEMIADLPWSSTNASHPMLVSSCTVLAMVSAISLAVRLVLTSVLFSSLCGWRSYCIDT